MIHEVSIQNFKSLRDVTVKLERFTVFVGANASGKTSVLQALDTVSRLFNPKPHQKLNLNDVVKYMSRGATKPLRLEAHTPKHWYRFRSPLAQGNSATIEVSQAKPQSTWSSWRPSGDQIVTLPASFFIRLEASKLIMPTVFEQNPAAMAPDGTGLHAALTSMVLNDPDAWQELQNELRSIIPVIKRLRHSKFSPGQVSALLFDTSSGDGLAAEFMSEGTLLILGLLTALRANDRPNLVFLDDMDRALHPRAQQDLAKLLRRMLDAEPDLQIVATTHSPYLLDCMQPSEVRMISLRDDGSTACAPLVDHPKFEKWKKEMAPGEMWTLFGEKWVAEKEAAV